MIIKRLDGCTTSAVYIDDVLIWDVPNAKLTEASLLLWDRIKVMGGTTDLVLSLLDNIDPDTYENSTEPCDQCGDYTSEEIWEV